MAIANKNDLTHIVRTTQQWTSSYDSYECIPEGVLCVEFTPDGHVKAKIGNGHDIFSKLPYIGGADLTNYFTKNETVKCVEDIIKANRFIRIKGILQNKDQLPSNAECGDLYFVISQNQSSSNKYDEYVYSPSNTWETLGSIPIDIDLSEYAKIVYVDEKIDEVNERIDDIEQHGTHTHANKDILDLITTAFTAEEKDKLSTLYNYDDTELRELITQASHTHSNKDILDAITAAYTAEEKEKLSILKPVDVSTIEEKITALERLAHEHSNKRILDRTTASFTTEYERKMRWIRIYTGCTGMEEGIAGLVPAAQAGEEDYVLSGSGEWVPQTGGGGTYTLPIATASTLGGIKVGNGLEIDANGVLSTTGGGGGGDSIAEGDGITITTDPQTGVKTISVNTGDNLEVDPNTGELNVTGVDYTAGKGIFIGNEYQNVEYIKNSGNYDQIILTDILPLSTDKLELDVKFGLDILSSYNQSLIGSRTSTGNMSRISIVMNNDRSLAFYNHYTWTSELTDAWIQPAYNIDDSTSNARQILSITGNLGTWGNQSVNTSSNYDPSFYDVSLPIAIFGWNSDGNLTPFTGKEMILYGVKHYDSNNTLLHNLVPVKRSSDNAGGLYDTITQKFYGNSGSGSFVTGPETTTDDRIINAKIGNGLQFDSNNAIEVNTGDGLTVNQNNELEVNIGTGLEIDPQTGAINVTGGGDSGNYIEGEAIEFEESASRLPTGYTELENISNISASYIDTGYIPNTDTQLSIIANIHRGTTSWQTLFGARDAVNPGGAEYAFFVRLNDNYNFYPRITGDQYTYMPNQTYDEKIRININNTTATVTRQDGSSYSYTQTGSLSNLSTTLAIFALHNQTGYVDNGIIDLYSFKIYENNTIVKDFVPCKRNSDDAIGLIDIINNVFYTNLGTGTFTAGRILTNTSINVKYGDGLTINQDNELEVNIGTGLEIDPQTGAINVTGGGGETYEAGNGISIEETTDPTSFRVVNQEYFFDTRGLTCGLNARVWTTVNDGDILAAMCIHNNGGNQVPLFVGLTEDSVKVSQNYDSNILGPNGSFDYHGKTWYFTADYALSGTDGQDTQNHIQTLPTTYSFSSTPSNFVPAAKDLIDLAVLLPDTLHPTISAKIGSGLSFDANGAIQADAQPLSPATDSTLGGVIVGDNLSIDSNGVLTANIINYSSGHAIEITGDLSIDKFRWEITKNAGDSMVAFRYFEYSDSTHIPFTIQAGAIAWSDGSTVSYPSGYDETFDGMMENRTKCTVTGWTGNKTLIMTFRLSQSIMLSDIAYFRWKTDDYMSGRQPQEFNIYAHDSINDEWILLKEVTDHALVPSSSNTWSTYIDIEPPEIESGSINVKYGNGLTLNQNNELEVATASASTLGGIKVGDGLSIAADGTLSATGGGSGGGNYSAGEAIEIDTSLFNVDAIRWDISDIKDPIQSFSANGPWAQVRYIQFRDNSNNAILIDSGSGVWSDDTAVSYYQDLTLANMIANTQKMCASWRSPDLTMKLTFLLDSPVNVSSVAKFRILLGDDEPHRDPKAWSIYVRNATTQEWHLVHTTADAQLPATRNVWTDDFLLENPNRSIINVKYGNGLTVNASNELEVDLPVASDSTLGGVIVGEGINVDEHGEISLSAGEGLDIDFESSLPSEYTLVKGISSVGHNDSPYINTGYLIKPTSRIIVQGVLYKTISGWTFPIGVRHNNYSNPVMFCTHHDSNGDSIELWLSNDTLIASATDREKCYNDPVTIIISSDGLSIENETTGEVVTLTTSDTLPIATLPLYVFATNDNNTLSFSGPMDLYRMQIFEGATKVLDYLPCKRNSDNKYGVYDIVANEYKASSNASLFELVTGTPSGDDLVQQIKLLPATENTIGGVKPGDGILVDSDGTISVDPTIIPEVIEYEGGTAISIEEVEHGGVIIDAWDGGTGWRNWAYTSGTGDGGISWNPEVHSPVADSWKIPAGAIQVRVKALSTSDVLLHPTMHWLTGKGTGRFGYSCPTGVMPYDYWIEVNSNATYMNLGIRKSEGSNIALSPSEIKSVELTFQTASEIEVDVWNGGTGWLNGDYRSGNSDSFVSDWHYTYHYNYQQYIEVPEGATHVMVRGISNENDSHFEGGGINAFDSNHHHVHWWDCTWEWHEISSDTVYVQPNVKWNNNNTRTISGSDVKSVTLVWKLPALEIGQAINVKYGNGLTVNQNNELEVDLGTGLEFDQTTGAINVTGGGGGDTIAKGDGITITTDSQTGIKTIGINVGDGLDIDPITNELFVNGQLPEGTIIKKMTYVGTGAASIDIQFTKKPIAILNIYGDGLDGNRVSTTSAPIDSPALNMTYGKGTSGAGVVSCNMSYNDTTNVLTLSGGVDEGARCNKSGSTYTMFYLTKGHTGSGTSVNNEVSVVKTFSYVGTGTAPNNIQFPETPNMVLSIYGPLGTSGVEIRTLAIDTTYPSTNSEYFYEYSQNGSGYMRAGTYSFNDTTNILSLVGPDYGASLNYSGLTYIVRYIVNETISSGGGGSGSYEPGTAIEFSNQQRKINPVMTSDVLPYGEVIESGYFSTRYGWNAFDGTDSQTWSSHAWSDGTNQLDDDPESCYVGYVFPEDVYLTEFVLSTYSDRTYTGIIQVRSEGTWTTVVPNVSVVNTRYIKNTYTLQTPVLCDAFRFCVLSGAEQYFVNASPPYGGNVCDFQAIGYPTGASAISVKYGDGLTVNQDNELEVNLGSGLQFDANGAIEVTGGGGGSGDTVAEGAGISINTDQQTGNKVIAVNAGAGLQVNQTTNELEVSSGVVTSIAPTQNTPGSITVTDGGGTATPVSVISQMGGATSSTAGTAGYVPAPVSGDDDAYLRGDGTWDDSVVTEDDELTLVFVPDDYQPS